jgi:hypothetical protein
VRRSSWLVLARVAGNIAVVAAIIATLLGYLNFAKFVNQQLIGGSIVVLAATLLFKFVDDLSTWMLNADSKVGQTILLSTGLSVSRLEQAGVLLSAALRTIVVLIALLALVAPFGNIGAVVERFTSLFTTGFDIGGTKLAAGGDRAGGAGAAGRPGDHPAGAALADRHLPAQDRAGSGRTQLGQYRCPLRGHHHRGDLGAERDGPAAEQAGVAGQRCRWVSVSACR